MNLTVGISSFGRSGRLLETVTGIDPELLLVNVNDADGVTAAKLRDRGIRTVLASRPQLFWQGMVALVEHTTTEWLLVTSDEDPPLPETLPNLEQFAEARQAGLVATPLWQEGALVKPSPPSWAGRLGEDGPLPPQHFHDLSGYISGTLLHRPTAAEQLRVLSRLAPENDYVAIYAIPALVALIGRVRPFHVYPHPVVSKGPALPGQQGVRGSDYFRPGARVRQKQHLAWFVNVIRQIDANYAERLDGARVYESRGWA